MNKDSGSLFNIVLDQIKANQIRRREGKIIAIPFPFPRFSVYTPGIQKGRYIIVTANSKVGKSKITDFVFVYNPIDFIINNPEAGLDIKTDYFSLEISKFEKIKQYVSFKLFVKFGIILSEEEIDSIYNRYILEDDVLKKIESLDLEVIEFEKRVNFIDTIRNPFGIYKHVMDYHEKNGVYLDRDSKVIPLEQIKNSDKEISRQAQSHIHVYKANNENLFYQVITDHVALLQQEDKDTDQRQTIGRFSSNYCIKMRDRWASIVINVQQQAAQQEGADAIKLSMTKPSANGLGINKNTQQDCDMILGLYAPIRYQKLDYKGYNLAHEGLQMLPLYDNHREFFTILNRRGGAAASTQLFFLGQSCFFKELPYPNDNANMIKVNDLIRQARLVKEHSSKEIDVEEDQQTQLFEE
jgi:replicative DNA helicase